MKLIEFTFPSSSPARFIISNARALDQFHVTLHMTAYQTLCLYMHPLTSIMILHSAFWKSLVWQTQQTILSVSSLELHSKRPEASNPAVRFPYYSKSFPPSSLTTHTSTPTMESTQKSHIISNAPFIYGPQYTYDVLTSLDHATNHVRAWLARVRKDAPSHGLHHAL